MADLTLLENKASKKLPDTLYKGLSIMFYEIGIDGKDVVNDFMNYYILHAYEKSNKLNNVYADTGFSKHIVDKFIKQSCYKPNPEKKKYYKSLISDLKDLSEKYTDGLIPIHGKFRSYTFVFNESKPSNNELTAPAMLKRLIRIGVVKKKGKCLKFISTMPQRGCLNMDIALEVFANTVHRVASTICHNMKTDVNDDTLFQSSYYSTQISPANYKLVTDGLRVELRKCIYNCQIIIESYEEKGFSKKQAESHSIELGASAFIFLNSK
ncbi:MAG: hypothetical protein JKX98_00155 [Alcanivoracaceae bacterium]|nr:hypothetical protein [Alcanivoracaceae bacterium]